MSLFLIIFHHSFLSLELCLLVFLPVIFLLFCVACLFVSVLCLILLLPISLSCVSFSDSPMFLCFLLSLVFVSRLNVLALCFFLLVPPLSHFLCFLLPRPPCALEKENHGKNNYLILFAFRGSLRKCPFAQHNCLFFSLVDFFCPQSMFLLDILGFFEGARDSLLLLICCYIVVLVFGEEPSLGPTCLFWIRSVLCSCFFLGGGGLLLLSSFAGFCFFVLFIFLIWGCCFFAAVWSYWFLTSCLGCVVLRVGFGAFVLW